MIRKPYSKQQAARLLPLILSIGREVEARTQEIARLEAHLALLNLAQSDPGGEISRTTAELAVNRRELRSAERELARLGCHLDAGASLCILCPAAEGDWAYDLRSAGAHAQGTPGKRRS